MVEGRNFPWGHFGNAGFQPHLPPTAGVRHLDTVALVAFMSVIILPLPRHVGRGHVSSHRLGPAPVLRPLRLPRLFITSLVQDLSSVS